MASKLHTVVKTASFVRHSKSLLNDKARKELINSLASDPMQGEKMKGAGGFRKLLWVLLGRGKSNCVRVITFFSDGGLPVFLITLFGKNEKANLSKAERNEFDALGKLIVSGHRKRRIK